VSTESATSGKLSRNARSSALGARHLKRRRITREKLLFQNLGIVRSDGLAQRTRHGAFETGVIFHRDEVENDFVPVGGNRRECTSLLKLSNHERAEDRDLVVMSEMVKLSSKPMLAATFPCSHSN